MPIELPLSVKIIRVLHGAGSHREIADALHTLLTKAVRGGEEKEAILAIMQELRSTVAEEQEDLLLEGMDWLYGWCHPDAKIE